jgi:hypothetical protein
MMELVDSNSKELVIIGKELGLQIFFQSAIINKIYCLRSMKRRMSKIKSLITLIREEFKIMNNINKCLNSNRDITMQQSK